MTHNPELDTLVEIQNGLQHQLDRVNRRIDHILGESALQDTIEFEPIKVDRQLTLVPALPEPPNIPA